MVPLSYGVGKNTAMVGYKTQAANIYIYFSEMPQYAYVWFFTI